MEFLNFLRKMNIARVRPFPKKPITEHIPHETTPAIHNSDIFLLKEVLYFVNSLLTFQALALNKR
jgi:hypothetical protein